MSMRVGIAETKQAEREAFHLKQEIYQKLTKTREKVKVTQKELKIAQEELTQAKIALDEETKVLDIEEAKLREIWAQHYELRDSLEVRAKTLRQRSATEHRKMRECFGQARNIHGSESRARRHTRINTGNKHRARRDKINEEIAELSATIRRSAELTQQMAPKIDKTAFFAAKARYTQAQVAYDKIAEKLLRLKGVQRKLQAAFDEQRKKYLRLRDALQGETEQ